jgi:hypothetical protein
MIKSIDKELNEKKDEIKNKRFRKSCHVSSREENYTPDCDLVKSIIHPKTNIKSAKKLNTMEMSRA